MTTPNHIAGGLVFSGTMLSFYNVNVFENPLYLSACIGFSLLPDIDTPKTIPGKVAYPIAVLINRKFGHRTITHSLIALAFFWLIFKFLSRFFSVNEVYVKIFFFSYLSHLILDMLTIQGVPLLYPFKRNPCVLPADPNFRLRTSNTRSETIVFTIFILLAFTMYPLFAQGFWTSYNRQFGTVAHCDRENTNSKNWIICEYEYIKNNKTLKNEAFILESNEKKLELFNKKEVFDISIDDRTISILKTKPRNSQVPKQFKELNFMNISIDSVNNIMKGKVCTGLIQSNKNVKYVDRGITYNTNFIKFANSFDFKVIAVVDSSRNELYQKLKSVNARIEKDSLKQMMQYSDLSKLENIKSDLLVKLNSTPDSNIYLKNKLQNEYIDISGKLKSFELKTFQIDIVLRREKENLLERIKESKEILFSGYLTYCIFD